jgi:uroporphyrinogen decarboxylase
LINAGADIICILEPTASILGPKEFRRFSGCYVKHIIESYKYANVETVYHTCGNTMHLIIEMASTGVAALSLDSPESGVDMAKAAQLVPENVMIMGNINPTYVLNDGSVEVVKRTTIELMEQMRPYPNFILSTGCDLPPETPIENIKAFMQAGRDFK